MPILIVHKDQATGLAFVMPSSAPREEVLIPEGDISLINQAVLRWHEPVTLVELGIYKSVDREDREETCSVPLPFDTLYDMLITMAPDPNITYEKGTEYNRGTDLREKSPMYPSSTLDALTWVHAQRYHNYQLLLDAQKAAKDLRRESRLWGRDTGKPKINLDILKSMARSGIHLFTRLTYFSKVHLATNQNEFICTGIFCGYRNVTKATFIFDKAMKSNHDRPPIIEIHT